jgi:hypothetical protein
VEDDRKLDKIQLQAPYSPGLKIWQVDGKTVDLQHNLDTQGWESGLHTITITAADQAGNEQMNNIPLYIEKMPEELPEKVLIRFSENLKEYKYLKQMEDRGKNVNDKIVMVIDEIIVDLEWIIAFYKTQPLYDPEILEKYDRVKKLMVLMKKEKNNYSNTIQ